MQILAKISLFIFTIILLCIYPLTAEIRTLSHDEKDNGPKAAPIMWETKIFDDNTIVMRLIRINGITSTATKTCFDEMLYFRVIYPNGTIYEKDIKLDIQSFNFCLPSVTSSPIGIYNSQAETNDGLDFVDYYLIRKKHILITYYNATDLSNVYTYEEWGMIIDPDGNVIDRISFGPAFINETTYEPTPINKIRLNINREKGFLRLAVVGTSSDVKLEWQQYRVEANGKFTKLIDGIIEFDNFSSLIGIMMPTVDEGYAIAYAESDPSATTNQNPLSSQGHLFVLAFEYGQRPTSPLLLYKNVLPNSKFIGLSCDIAYAGVGHDCTLSILQHNPNPTNQLPDQIYYVKVNFLSSGSVIDFTAINFDNKIAIPNETNTVEIVWVVNALPFGGYLLTGNVGNNMYGYLFGDDEIFTPWEFPEPITTNNVYEVLRNNTLLVGNVESNTWKFQIIDLPRSTDNDGKGYSGNVVATFPAIQSSIDSNIPKISINFKQPVELSDGNLTIYQVIDEIPYLRQTIPSKFFSIGTDGKNVSADILFSTFTVSKGNYSIEVDNNFVKDKTQGEPLLGIRDNVWWFTTDEINDTFSPTTTGLLRLNVNGTQTFDSFSRDERRDFFNHLLVEISEAIPISLSRLATVGKVQLDNRSSERKYLISVQIIETRDDNDNSVDSVFEIIDSLLLNRNETQIGTGLTSYLDEYYGFRRLPNLWRTYKMNLIALFLIVGILIIMSILAEVKTSLLKDEDACKPRNIRKKVLKRIHKKEDPLRKKYGNTAILQLGVIIFDLIMDFLFVRTNSKDIYVLYIPSIIFFALPIAVNTVLTFSIITQENGKPKFFQWFIHNGSTAILLSLVACTDIAGLNILKSYFAGFESFNAPFSSSAKSKIIWGNLLNIFIEDIPQFIIQVYYVHNAVSYDIIPLLALISSSISLAMDLVDLLYEATHRVAIPEYDLSAPEVSKKDDFKIREKKSKTVAY